MNKKRALLVVMCCALVGAFFVMPYVRVSASTATITFGDSAGDLEYSLYAAGATSGQAVESSGGNPGYYLKSNATTTGTQCLGATNFSMAGIDIPWYGTHINSITVDGYGNHGYSLSVDTSVANGTPLSLTAGWHTQTFTINADGVTWIRIYSATCYNLGSYNGLDNVSIDYGATSATLTPTPTATIDPYVQDWNKPLRSGDQKLDDPIYHAAHISGGGLIRTAYSGPDYANVGFSSAAGVFVFAVIQGTISAVEPFVCAPLFGPDRLCEIIWAGMPNSRYAIPTQGVFLVTESLADGRFVRYVIASPLVAVGDSVSGGCTIGMAPDVFDYFGNKIGEGAILIQGLETDNITAFDMAPLLITEPSAVACHINNSAPCALVNNPGFLAALGGWELNPGRPETYIPYLLPDGGVFFPLSIAQTLNLDPASAYRIELLYEVQADSPAQHLSVKLGTTQTELYLDSTVGKTSYVIPGDTYTADQAGGLYSFGIEGLEDASKLTLFFACVQDASDSIPVPGEGCVLLDPHFNQKYTESPWTISGSPDPPAVIPGGMAVIPDGGFISQSITLWPGDGGANVNYDLLVTYRRQGIASAGKDIKLGWAFGGSSGELEPTSVSQTWADYTATFGVATNVVTDDLILTGIGSDSVQAAQISSVCIHTHDGNTPPGYRPPLPFTGGCRYCVYTPVGDVATDVSEFQQWLGCQFFQLWECQAKILLRYIWHTLTSILTLLGFFRLWLSSLIIGLVSWGNGNLVVFSQWLYGQINNAAQEIVYAILSTIGGSVGGGTNMWDFLIALIGGIFGLLQVFVQLVANIMQLIIAGVIGFLVNGIGLLLGLLQSVINGLNTAPATINAAWLPNCNDATSGLFVVCSAIYGVEAGLAIGPFQYLIPIGIGLGALNLLWWGIAKIRGVFTE